ncbi:MAG: ribonuclease J [Pseudomonadota bacterium]
MAKSELVFLPLGGSGEIGMNMNLYGHGPASDRQWIMIDCGVTFGDLTTPGIDLICPDPTYILEERDRLLGLLLTHGHEDHIGAVALLAPELGCPVYATPFTAQLVERKFEEADIDVDLRVIRMGSRFSLGPFDLEYITLTHSIPEPNAIAIRTELANVLHTGDWKIDRTPTLGPETDHAALQVFAEEDVHTIVCDSTNVFSPGESGSEEGVRAALTDLITAQKGRVVVTTFASNVSRVVSICQAAQAADRSICLLGRSMLRIVGAAQAVDLIPSDISFVEPKDAGYLPREHVLYLCTGSQGEPRAALSRLARDDHPELSISEGDTVIFSSKIIPGNEREIFDLQNQLVDLGAQIVTEKDAPIHVSGHPNRDELSQMYDWVKPKHAIPVHGEVRHLEEHAKFARTKGVAKAIAPRNGTMIRLTPGEPEIIDEVPNGRWYLDGNILFPDGSYPVKERRKLGYAGLLSVAVVLDSQCSIAAPIQVFGEGVPRETDDGEDFMALLEEAAEDALERLSRGKRDDDQTVENTVRRTVRTLMNEIWGKRPQVLVQLLRT